MQQRKEAKRQRLTKNRIDNVSFVVVKSLNRESVKSCDGDPFLSKKNKKIRYI